MSKPIPSNTRRSRTGLLLIVALLVVTFAVSYFRGEAIRAKNSPTPLAKSLPAPVATAIQKSEGQDKNKEEHQQRRDAMDDAVTTLGGFPQNGEVAAPELPDDLKAQLEAPPPELPDDLKAQLEAPPPELPEDIKRAMSMPPRAVSIEEVNTTSRQ